MKTTRHSLMAKGILVLLSLLILIFVFTYSWFVEADLPANAGGISATVEANGDFEYAIGFYNDGSGGAYKVTEYTSDSTALNLKQLAIPDGTSESYDYTSGGVYYHYYDLLHDYQPIDITGDGVNLIRPAMLHGNTGINTSSEDYSIATTNKQYINFDLYFRSESPGVPIKLTSGSYAKADCETTVGDGNIASASTGVTNQSSYSSADNGTTGNYFSKDAIVGAVRIALTPYLYASAPATLADYQSDAPSLLDGSHTIIWLPRPDIRVVPTDTMANWTCNLGTYPAAYSAADAVHQYYDIFKPGSNKQIATYSNTITPANINAAPQLMTTIGNSFHYGSYYYTKVNVRIWIEGTDTEARRALSGGTFSVNFKFTTND